MTCARTVLVYRTLGLGDLLTSLPALRAIARAFPRHRRVLLTRPELAGLARHAAAADEVVAAAELEPIEWRRDAPDVAINLHGRGPQSHRTVEATRPSRLIAFEHADVERTRGGPKWSAGEHEVHRWCRLLHESGIRADPGELDLDVPAGAPAYARGATLIHPGAAYAARRWPADRWSAVARAEAERGRRVVVTGTRSELGLAQRVARAAGLPEDSVLAGRTDTLQLAALVGVAARVVCGDTGVAHLATALRTPSVVLFGPTSPAEWGPPADRGIHRVLWAGVRGDANGTSVHEGLLRIDVPAVLGAIANLDRTAAPRPLLASTGGGAS